MQWLESDLIGAYALGLIVLFVLIRLFYVPLKMACKLFLNAVGGGLMLYVFNFVGAYAGMRIGINLFTALCAGVLGIPGLSLLLLLQIVFQA